MIVLVVCSHVVSISFRSKVIQHFRFGLKFPFGADILGFFGNSRPLSACIHQRDRQNAPHCVKPRRLSHHACLCDAPFGRYAIARKEIQKKEKKISKEYKSHSRYISRMRGGALMQPIAIEVCTSV
jgi:hypothetical protein